MVQNIIKFHSAENFAGIFRKKRRFVCKIISSLENGHIGSSFR